MIDQFNSKTIAVVGDLILDEYTYGEVARISPEAPVPVLKITSRDYKLGGSGNVLLNLRALKMKCLAFGRIGGDVNGEKLKSMLNSAEVNAEGVIESESMPTITKNRVVASNQQVVRIDDEHIIPLHEDKENQVIERLTKQLDLIDAIVLSDYGKGFLTQSLISKVIDLANEKKIPVVVDPKSNDFGHYQGATVITPNAKEAKEAAPHSKGLEETAELLIGQADLKFLMITRGSEGISYFKKSSGELIHQHYPVVVKGVTDVTGAGDTVVAVTVMCLANQISHEQLCIACNLAAGYVVGFFGAQTISLEKLKSLMLDKE